MVLYRQRSAEYIVWFHFLQTRAALDLSLSPSHQKTRRRHTSGRVAQQLWSWGWISWSSSSIGEPVCPLQLRGGQGFQKWGKKSNHLFSVGIKRKTITCQTHIKPNAMNLLCSPMCQYWAGAWGTKINTPYGVHPQGFTTQQGSSGDTDQDCYMAAIFWTTYFPVSVFKCAQLLQLCLTLCEPMDRRLLCPWYFPSRNTGVGCHAYSESCHQKLPVFHMQLNMRQPLVRISVVHLSIHVDSPSTVEPFFSKS